jgi:hypothetical protein
MGRPRLLLPAAGVAVVALLAALAAATPASAQIWWANEGSDSIGRAELDGSAADGDAIADPGILDPNGVAIDGEFAYVSHASDADTEGAIGRVPLTGGAAQPEFVVVPSGTPGGVAIDTGFIYWTRPTIGRAGLDGAPVTPAFINAANSGPAGCGIASDGDEIIWATPLDTAPDPDLSARLRAAHGQFAPNPNFLPGQNDPCGVARAGSFVYWTNRGDDTIGRAGFDGSNPDPDFIQLSPGTDPCGIAVDETHLYWTNRTTETIGRIDAPFLGAPDEDFIPASAEIDDPCGIAVPPTMDTVPSGHDFGLWEAGTESEIQAFLVSNTGSSVLDVTDLSLGGSNPEDFEITGDACTRGAVPAGNGCVVNVRFSPTAQGDRGAVLTVASNASDSPAEIALAGDGQQPTPSAPPPLPEPEPDGEAPQILAADVKPARFEVRRNGPVEIPAARARKGTRFTYELSEAALLVIQIERRSNGDLKRIGSFAQQSQAGASEKPFSGWIGQRRLRPGRHLATLFAIDAAGNFSQARELGFRVLDPER